MTKYMVCVTKRVEVFEYFFVEAPNDLEAKTEAIRQAKTNPEVKWTEGEKAIFKTEVIR